MELCQIATLGSIAVLAQELNVPGGIVSPHRERNDVVELKVRLRPTSHAPSAVTLPYKQLDFIGDRLALRDRRSFREGPSSFDLLHSFTFSL